MQLQSIIQQYKPTFIEKYGNRLLPGQWRAINACNAAAQQTLANFRCNAHSVSKTTGIPCHAVTEAAPSARTMAAPDHPWSPLHSDSCLSSSVNGLTANRKSYCLLSILWRPLPCPTS